jgi:hypothetical protein
VKPFRFDCLVFVLIASLLPGCTRKESVSHEGNSPLFIDETTLKKGDIIQPFAYINPGDHEWKVEIRISGEDQLDLGVRKMTSRKFWTTKNDVLEKIRQWKFVYGRSSSHPAHSTLRVYRDNQLVEKHGIIIEKHTMGFQSVKYGMLEPVDWEEMFKLIEHMNHY